MVFHLFAAQREQFFQILRHGDDGRTRIKSETVLLVHIGAATRHVQFFQHLHLIAFDAQADGCSQSTKATANDHGAQALRVAEVGSFITRNKGIHTGLTFMAQPHRRCKGKAKTISTCSTMAKPNKEDNKTQPVLISTSPLCKAHTIHDQMAVDKSMVR